jgi:hypothetical protein
MFFNLVCDIYNKPFDKTSREVIGNTMDRMKLAQFCKIDNVAMLMGSNYRFISNEAKSLIAIAEGEYYLMLNVGKHWLMY